MRVSERKEHPNKRTYYSRYLRSIPNKNLESSNRIKRKNTGSTTPDKASPNNENKNPTLGTKNTTTFSALQQYKGNIIAQSQK